jgi:hypothetical protein
MKQNTVDVRTSMFTIWSDSWLGVIVGVKLHSRNYCLH